MPEAISMYCVPFIEIIMSSIANRTIGMVLSSMKMPNLRNASLILDSLPGGNFGFQWYDVRTTALCNVTLV